ncbi:helix-turn-helix domain-containing protein [Actinoplanes sp. NPDC048791]|uniref:TetR/AcrR family transcriptional regulator n=1 Tax=Actinoplanes sp. NPDC048791 TaxID=3154623 RepID=UPI0033F9F603
MPTVGADGERPVEPRRDPGRYGPERVVGSADPVQPRLTADDWTSAALEAMAGGGLAAVAVEPLAARLGATKGSFYWHFANRDALIEAAVLRWERDHTEAVIGSLPTAEADRHRYVDQVIHLLTADRVIARPTDRPAG